jgi:hypothetical protein
MPTLPGGPSARQSDFEWRRIMKKIASIRLPLVAVAIALAGLLLLPGNAAAQTVTGQARAVQAATILGTTTLADTGTLGSIADSRDATLDTGRVASLVKGEVLRAVTVGWADQVASEASLANVTMTVAGTGISAGVALARVLATQNAPAAASSSVGDLAVNGLPVQVTGEPNQAVAIPGGRIVINEQIVSPTGTTVNALHVTVRGVADVVIASATAGIR